MSELSAKMNRLKVCVIIPTYNNEKTLARVIDSVLLHTHNLIIVNDGATDSTAQILGRYPDLVHITHDRNFGKGRALRNGLAKARQMGFEHAITIDSDGQHYASDLTVFIEQLEIDPTVLLIGGRNMTQEGVPRKSSFGNTFSNFWFWFETGIRLQDTQSGYRSYPLRHIPRRYFTRKFEFEIEIIVRTAWKGVPVRNVPIQVLYDPTERVSHFRPFKDFTRISILNTVLVTICLLWIFPRNIFLKLKRKGLKRFLLENVLESSDSPRVKALSIALGVFIGISPFWGFQTVLALFFATVLRLNKAIAYLFSNVSIPPMIPLVVAGSLWVGRLFYDSGAPLFPELPITFEKLQSHLAQYLIGSLILATIAAVISGGVAFWIMSAFKKDR